MRANDRLPLKEEARLPAPTWAVAPRPSVFCTDLVQVAMSKMFSVLYVSHKNSVYQRMHSMAAGIFNASAHRLA